MFRFNNECFESTWGDDAKIRVAHINLTTMLAIACKDFFVTQVYWRIEIVALVR